MTTILMMTIVYILHKSLFKLINAILSNTCRQHTTVGVVFCCYYCFVFCIQFSLNLFDVDPVLFLYVICIPFLIFLNDVNQIIKYKLKWMNKKASYFIRMDNNRIIKDLKYNIADEHYICIPLVILFLKICFKGCCGRN